LRVLTQGSLLIFCACALLFTFANAPTLMLISGTLSAKGSNPSLLIAACIVLPQIVVALASPTVGRFAERYGRRIVLMVGSSMVALRCLIFAVTQNPPVLVAAQVFDGVAGACFGIMVPLIVSDVAGRSGHFNLALGAVGLGMGLGSTLSMPAAGWAADHLGSRPAFFALMGIGILAVLSAALMPETRPDRDAEQDSDAGANQYPGAVVAAVASGPAALMAAGQQATALEAPAVSAVPRRSRRHRGA
jgi:MFS family permease